MSKILAAFLAVSMASSAGALTVKAGYGSIAGVNDYQVRDRAPAPDQYTNESEDVSLGLFNIGAEQMIAINETFSVGFEVGAGAPLGEYKFEDTKLTKGWAAGAIDPDTGDYVTYKAATATILVKGSAAIKAGSGMVSVGLGVGTVLVGLIIDDVDQGWKDLAGNGSWNKNDATDIEGGMHTLSNSVVVPVFCIQVTPGYRMALTDTDSIGVELPISVNSVTKALNYDEVDLDPVDPDIENPSNVGAKIGGISWGINLVYTKKM